MVRRLFHLTRRTRAYRSFMRWMLRHLLSLHGSPEAVALGTAIGVFIAFTPTMGFQMLLALAVATLVGANRVAAIPPVWISNPATAAPIYLFCYRAGRLVVEGPGVKEAGGIIARGVAKTVQMALLALSAQFTEAWKLGQEVFTEVHSILLPLWMGSLAVGTLLGLVTYAVVLRLVLAFRHLVKHRRLKRKRRRASGNRQRRRQEGKAHESAASLP